MGTKSLAERPALCLSSSPRWGPLTNFVAGEKEKTKKSSYLVGHAARNCGPENGCACNPTAADISVFFF